MLRNRTLNFWRAVSPVASSTTAAACSPARYRVVVLALPKGVARVYVLAQAALHDTDVVVVGHTSQPAGSLVKWVLTVNCSIPARAVLSRLVGQLGLVRGVRSVQWESVPRCAPDSEYH